jgi:hypothetical protein
VGPCLKLLSGFDITTWVGIEMKLRQLIIGEFDGAILNAIESQQSS